MGVRTHAQIRRDNVIFVGEPISVVVTLENHSSVDEAVAWGSAQVRCQCSVHRGKVTLPRERGELPVVPERSFAFSPEVGERGTCVFETNTSILFCDLTLKPREVRHFTYTATVAATAPPSFRGEAISYSYKVVIGMQRPAASSILLRVPFRVLPLSQMVLTARRKASLPFALNAPPSLITPQKGHRRDDSYCSSVASSTVSSAVSPRVMHVQRVKLRTVGSDSPSEAATSAEDGDISEVDSVLESALSALDEAPSQTVHPTSALLRPNAGGVMQNLNNPFRKPPKEGELSTRPLTISAIDELARRRKPNAYAITLKDKAVVKFHLTKQTYRIGEDILGWFDFTEANVVCHQASVTLVAEEDIAERYRNRSGLNQTPLRDIYSRSQHVCKDRLMVPLMLPIPLTCCPQFKTEIITMRWKLNLEFLITKDKDRGEKHVEQKKSGDVLEVSNQPVKVEKVKWSLPLQVLPTDPVHIPFSQVQFCQMDL